MPLHIEEPTTTVHVLRGGWASIIRRELETLKARMDSPDARMFSDDEYEIIVTVEERRKA